MLENWDSKAICRLSRLTLIAFSGKDVRQFLQGQLTLDVSYIGTGLSLAGYCDPKGRLLATPRFFTVDNDIWAIVPCDMVDMLIARLRLYTLRRDVSIEAMPQWHVYGTLGALNTDKVPVALSGRTFTLSYTTIVLCKETLPAEAPEEQWWHEAALARRPWVFKTTQGRFLPQSLNLDRLDAISFNKGCYTGQEVVGRLHNSGHIARRMYLYTGPAIPMTEGTDVLGETGVATATLVYASEGAYLFELAQKQVEETLRLDANTLLRRINEDFDHETIHD